MQTSRVSLTALVLEVVPFPGCGSPDSKSAVCLLQIRFQPNDHKTIKETADELKIFEGLKHPNLVRYFGVELHRVSHRGSHCVCEAQ